MICRFEAVSCRSAGCCGRQHNMLGIEVSEVDEPGAERAGRARAAECGHRRGAGGSVGMAGSAAGAVTMGANSRPQSPPPPATDTSRNERPACAGFRRGKSVPGHPESVARWALPTAPPARFGRVVRMDTERTQVVVAIGPPLAQIVTCRFRARVAGSFSDVVAHMAEVPRAIGGRSLSRACDAEGIHRCRCGSGGHDGNSKAVLSHRLSHRIFPFSRGSAPARGPGNFG